MFDETTDTNTHTCTNTLARSRIIIDVVLLPATYSIIALVFPLCARERACVFASAPARVDDVDDDVSDALSRRVLSGFCAVGWAPCRPVSADVVDARHVGVSASFGVVTTINSTDVWPEYLIW